MFVITTKSPKGKITMYCECSDWHKAMKRLEWFFSNIGEGETVSVTDGAGEPAHDNKIIFLD